MMKTKTIRTALIAALIMCLLSALAACGTPAEDKTYDEAFINDLKKGLMNRWDIGDQGADESDEIYLGRCVDAELDYIGGYTDKKFTDTELQERAINYINLLNKQKEALTYFSSDYTKGNELWEDARGKRTQAVRAFIEDYSITFPEKYNDILKEFENAAKAADEDDKLEEDVKTMLDGLTFTKVKEEYNYKYYEAVIENITDKTFEYFNVDVSLVDEDGVIVDTMFTSAENLAPGRKAKLEFSTDKDFAAMEYTADYY